MADMAKEKQEWADALREAARAGNYAKVVELAANNVGDKGDVLNFVDWLAENLDPSSGWRKALKG